MTQTGTLHVWKLPRRRRPLKVLVLRYVWLAVIVFAASWCSLSLGAVSSNLACVWIGNGLYIGFVLCVNPRRRNELLPVAVVINYITNRMSHLSPAWSLCLTLADVVQILFATYAFRRVPVRAIDLTDLRTLLRVGWFASLVSCAGGVVALVVMLHFMLHVPFDDAFYLSWFCSDAVGAALVIPLYWFYRRKPRIQRTTSFKYDQQSAFLLFLLVLAAIFWQTRFPFLFLLFPALIPVVYTSAFFGAIWAVLATTVVAVFCTAYGHGPLMLIHATAETRVLVLQFYLAILLITAFPFAVLLLQREKLVQQLKTNEARYRELARLDGLTQLPNRREFDSFLDISRQRAVRQHTPLSLLLIDIDHFKKLNDQHGHTVGDEYLRKVAAAVASAVPRKTDLVARYGGEEFAVVLDSCDDPGALMVAERVKAAVAALSRSLTAKNRPSVTVSIGMATTLPELRTSSKTLIDAADQGLYAAKRAGRDRIERGTNLIGAALQSIT